MSRSGYSEDGENFGLWRGAVSRAINGKRGQALLIAIRDALDAMPVKELTGGSFGFSEDGSACHCTLGVLGAQRGVDLRAMENAADRGDYELIGDAFGSARALVQEIMFMNDEGEWRHSETPSERWQRMRDWVADQIVEVAHD